MDGLFPGSTVTAPDKRRDGSDAGSIHGRLVQRDELTAHERDALFGLLSTYFDGVEREAFERDLGGKNWTVLLEATDGALVGFTTLHVHRATFEDEPITVVYSGDTIVDKAAWRTPTLHRTWIDSVLRLGQSHGEGRLFWQLIVSGYRTYRLLPVFFRKFYPRHDTETPAQVQALMHTLSRDRFGDDYDPEAGVVRFTEGAHRLHRDVGGITAARLRNPHVRFFAERNPGHDDGDELVCITEICPENLTRAGVRMTRR